MSVISLCSLFFFFFKQKTAYEIVSGDWSSDVCSSDLGLPSAERAPWSQMGALADSPLLTDWLTSTRARLWERHRRDSITHRRRLARVLGAGGVAQLRVEHVVICRLAATIRQAHAYGHEAVACLGGRDAAG